MQSCCQLSLVSDGVYAKSRGSQAVSCTSAPEHGGLSGESIWACINAKNIKYTCQENPRATRFGRLVSKQLFAPSSSKQFLYVTHVVRTAGVSYISLGWKLHPPPWMFSLLVASLLGLHHGRYMDAPYICFTLMPITTSRYMLVKHWRFWKSWATFCSKRQEPA